MARDCYLDALEVGRASDRPHAFLYTPAPCVAGLAAAAAVEGRLDEAASLWAAAERYCELRGAELGIVERKRYLARLAVVPPELLTAARDRWNEATAADVEESAAAAAD